MNDRTESPQDRKLEEQLEQYVLGRLSPADRAAFEARLAEDPDLREALARERDINEGVRRMGREILKRRIAAASKSAPRTAVPWVRIAALAAMILVVTGVALWQRWFFPGPAGERETTEPMAAERAPGTSTDAAPAVPERTSPEARSNEFDRTGSRDEKGPGTDLATTPPGPHEETKRASAQKAAGGAIERTYESGGFILRDDTTGLTRTRSAKDDLAMRPDQRLTKSETRGVEAEARAKAKERGQKYDGAPGTIEDGRPDGLTYRVEIAPTPGTAGTSEGAAQGAGAPDTVHFTVRVKGDSVTISLPPDRPGLNARAASEARVTRVSPDSVIIEVGDVRIRGYLPRESPH